MKTGKIVTLDDVYGAATPVVELSADMRARMAELRTFLMEGMYQHPQVRGKGEEGQRIVHALCDAYVTAPPEKVRQLQARTGSSLTEAVKDYVAGMTDAYAAEQFTEITGVSQNERNVL